MNFFLEFSLEHIALVKIVVDLWNQKDVRQLMATLESPQEYNIYDIKERVLEKVPQLALTQLLTEKAIDLIVPIGLEILSWIEFHCKHFDIHACIPVECCWTPQGTIDRMRTAKILVKDHNLDIFTRYKVTCFYFLEEENFELRKSMLEAQTPFLEIYLTDDSFHCMVRKGLGDVPISYKEAFSRYAVLGSKVATEYFLQKLSPLEKEETLVETAKKVDQNDVFRFLLSKMNENQQMDFFKSTPRRVLENFLEFPLQSFFMKIANCVWEFLTGYDYDWILHTIMRNISGGDRGWNYQNLFVEFWKESPGALKTFIRDEFYQTALLGSLMYAKHKEYITLILKDATTAVKENLVYCDYMNYYYYPKFIRKNELDFLGFLIRECLASKADRLKFKEKFEKLVMIEAKNDFARIKHKWDQLFLSEDDSIGKIK